jgi:hypothetical protein
MRLVAITILALSSCAHLPQMSEPPNRFTIHDSLTTAVWHMDAALTEDAIQDAGLHALHGTAGQEVRTDQGYRGRCKVFNGLSDSFVYIAHSAILDSMDTIVVDAQVMFEAGASQGFNTIAGRWSPRPELQSWILFLGGPPEERTSWPPAIVPSLDQGKVYFALMLDTAPMPRVFVANGFEEWQNDRWNHVAVSFDGSQVSFYLNGRLDSLFPCFGRIRPSWAPLTIGNLVDISYDTGTAVWYRGLDGAGFKGMIDELRISRVARADRPTTTDGSDR